MEEEPDTAPFPDDVASPHQGSSMTRPIWKALAKKANGLIQWILLVLAEDEEAEFSTKLEQEGRMAACRSCGHYNSSLDVCDVHGGLMGMKVKFSMAECELVRIGQKPKW